MRINIFILLVSLSMVSCRSNDAKYIENQQFNDIKVEEFKKKNVGISTTLRFYNAGEKSLDINYIECDILVNGKDVGTFIKKKSHQVPSKSIFEMPISVDFKPEDAFLNLNYGIIKIKSDVVSEVRLEGYMTSVQNGKEEKIKLTTTQQVLFSNNKDLYLDDQGQINTK